MAETLRSVGLDVGTSTTQMTLSELTVENQASSFAVPEMDITNRKILYRSNVHFTPLLDESRMDGDAIRQIVTQEYEKAGITRNNVDTGAIIITGETSRKENARAVLASLSDMAGEFVVATAGPALESALAARGSGAVDLSARTGKTVLHMDIGGGTSNLALIADGRILRTGCLNVGGRLLKFDDTGTVTYVSPVLAGLTQLQIGCKVDRQQVETVAQLLVQALEMAAGLQSPTPLLEQLTTAEIGSAWAPAPPGAVISFSGGVADCIDTEQPWLAFGDMGPILGQVIRRSRLCTESYVLGEETIRATVIGAGCHSAQLSGSTVFTRNVSLPMKNLPVITITAEEQESPELSEILRSRLASQDADAVLALPGYPAANYRQITALAEALTVGISRGPVYLALEQDMAKALGQALGLRLSPERPLLCLDRLRLEDGSYLDVGQPVGPALPVVIKTIILSHH